MDWIQASDRFTSGCLHSQVERSRGRTFKGVIGYDLGSVAESIWRSRWVLSLEVGIASKGEGPMWKHIDRIEDGLGETGSLAEGIEQKRRGWTKPNG